MEAIAFYVQIHMKIAAFKTMYWNFQSVNCLDELVGQK